MPLFLIQNKQDRDNKIEEARNELATILPAEESQKQVQILQIEIAKLQREKRPFEQELKLLLKNRDELQTKINYIQLKLKTEKKLTEKEVKEHTTEILDLEKQIKDSEKISFEKSKQKNLIDDQIQKKQMQSIDHTHSADRHKELTDRITQLERITTIEEFQNLDKNTKNKVETLAKEILPSTEIVQQLELGQQCVDLFNLLQLDTKNSDKLKGYAEATRSVNTDIQALLDVGKTRKFLDSKTEKAMIDQSEQRNQNLAGYLAVHKQFLPYDIQDNKKNIFDELKEYGELSLTQDGRLLSVENEALLQVRRELNELMGSKKFKDLSESEKAQFVADTLSSQIENLKKQGLNFSVQIVQAAKNKYVEANQRELNVYQETLAEHKLRLSTSLSDTLEAIEFESKSTTSATRIHQRLGTTPTLSEPSLDVSADSTKDVSLGSSRGHSPVTSPDASPVSTSRNDSNDSLASIRRKNS